MQLSQIKPLRRFTTHYCLVSVFTHSLLLQFLSESMSSLSPSYLHALLSTHYLPLELQTSHRDRKTSIFTLMKSRHLSNSTHESIYCKKRAFDLSFHRGHTFWSHNMLAHYGSVQSIHLSPDETLLASGGEDGRLLVWDIQKSIRSSDVTRETGAGYTELLSMKPLGFYSVAFGAGGDQVILATLLCIGMYSYCIDMSLPHARRFVFI